MENNLTTGIISSLLASVIFAILIVLFKESWIPLIRSFFYRGPNIWVNGIHITLIRLNRKL